METVEINKKFKNIEECKKWEKEHIKDYTKGKPTSVMYHHEKTTENDEVLLKSVTVF